MTITAKQTTRTSNLRAFLSLTAKQIADLEAENYAWYARMAETRLNAVAKIARSIFPTADAALLVIAEDFAGLIGALDSVNGTIWREDFEDETAMLVVKQNEPEFAAAADLLDALHGNPAMQSVAWPAGRTLSKERQRELLIFGESADYWVIQLAAAH